MIFQPVRSDVKIGPARAHRNEGPYFNSKLELKSNLNEIFPVNCKFICCYIFFALKVRL